jgi:hypothetical protein
MLPVKSLSRMRRVLFPILSGISLCLCLLFLYTWLRSYLPRHSRFDTEPGRILIIFWDGSVSPDSMYQIYNPANERFYGPTSLRRSLKQTSDYHWLGFQSTKGQISSLRFHLIAMPLWCLILLTATPPALWFFSHRRRLKRHKTGHCLSCGYDLRESKDNCPECGAAIPAAVSSAAP